MRESKYQQHLIQKLQDILPGCFIIKNDSSYLQGIPDLLILFDDMWAMLEVKAKEPTEHDFQPNQEYYIEKFKKMSFGAVIYPEIEERVLCDLQQAFFDIRKRTCVPESE